MEGMTLLCLVILSVIGVIAWIGGGRKWAFRTLLSVVVLAGLGVAGVLLYAYWTDKTAEHRMHKIHDCAIAKIATAHCVPTKGSSEGPWQDYAKGETTQKGEPEVIWDVCPAYMLSDNPTPEQENAAVAAAEDECRGEIDPKQKSVHEQVSGYKREHGIKPQASGAVEGSEKLSSKDCAAKVRTFNPHAYDDMDDATLSKRVLAKYPDYCDATSSPPSFIEEITGIR